MSFQRATRKKAKARVGIVGPAGSGKTMSALLMAFGMGGKIAVIDTENGSADLYAHLGEYDVALIHPPFTVKKYLDLIHEAEKVYDIVIIDSLSHAWAGTGGLLEEVDKRAGSGNKFAAWRDVTPTHNSLIDAMLQSPAHIIATMRSKTEYVIEENANGKKVPRKIGMAPVQREGMDYEFTVVFDVDQNKHYATTSKDRTSLFDGKCDILSQVHGQQLREWLGSGIEAPNRPQASTNPATPTGTDTPAQKLLAELAEFCGGVEDMMNAALIEHSTFTGNNGPVWLTLEKLKTTPKPGTEKRFETWCNKTRDSIKKAKESAKAEICAECRQPIVNNTCGCKPF
jgi:hypothetical protein